jgi:hypothetical protein
MSLLLTLYLLFCFTAQASFQIKTEIHDIDDSDPNETLIFLTSGHVVRINKNESAIKYDLKNAKESHQSLNLTLSNNHKIERYNLMPSRSSKLKKEFGPNKRSNETYTPTIIENMDLVNTYFKESRYVNKDSQCFNRAHIWSYEWFIKRSINSNKTWIFFTRRYIRKFKFDWWFHVSPSVRVIENGTEREKIMDFKYARGPLDPKKWTDIFMRDDANCPLVKVYSEYANFPESGSCYTMRTSMFYYQPIDIESKETWETVRANWYETEIKQAYLEAFDEVL